MRRARRIYRLFLKLYPARFREEYAAPLERQFADEYRDAAGEGRQARFWFAALRDLLVSIPRELARELARDVAFALRIYRKRLPVTGLAIAALALGIGATTGVFSVLNAVLLRSLPFSEPERLVELESSGVNAIMGRAGFNKWQEANGYLAGAATFAAADMNLALGGETVRSKVAETSAGFFSVLGVRPAFGRTFAPEEDAKGATTVAVIGYGFWEQFFGGRPDVLGEKIVLNGTPATVIGVAPAGFDYPGKVAVWLPSVFDFEKFPKSGVTFWRTVGRLQPGLTMARGRAMFLADTARRNPRRNRRPPAGFVIPEPALTGIRDQLAGPVREASMALLGITVFVLLIACANVAHLLLSRFAERRQELAIRLALGASRARLAQQAIAESLLPTAVACAAGIGVAFWATRLAAAVQPATLAGQDYSVLDWRVLLFAISLAGATGITFGSLPALSLGSVRSPAGRMRAGGGSGRGAGRIRAALIAVQAAFALALLAGSLIMGRAFLQLLATDLGFRSDGVVTLNASLSGTRYAANHAEGEYYRAAVQRLRSIPGVKSAAAAQFVPLVENMYMGQPFSLDAGRSVPTGLTIAISPDYFRTMGARLLRGREFTDADRARAEAVAIVSRDFADTLGVGDSAVGLRVTGWGGRVYTIVGIAADERMRGPSSKLPPQVWFPMDQSPPGFATFVARVEGDAKSYLAVCRDALRQVDPQVAVYDVKMLNQRLADNLARPRFYATAMVFFAGFGLLLAVTGVYGMAAYAIAQRTHEIGVRMAVGAGAGRVRWMLLRQGMMPLSIGLVLGAAAAIALSKSLQALIADAPRLDSSVYSGAALALAAAAASAIWVATRRIAEVDPMRSLRAE